MRNVYCAQKLNTFQTVYDKCVLCTKTEHFPGGTSEMCTVHKKRIFSRQYIKNVYCSQKHNIFQTVYEKCVLYTETEHFSNATHKAVSTDHKTSLNKKLSDLQSFKYPTICS